jgi:quercetin dioxygenase-like cupin family protein
MFEAGTSDSHRDEAASSREATCLEPTTAVSCPHGFLKEDLVKTLRMVSLCALMTGWAIFNVGALGQEKPESAASHMIVRSADLKWTAVMKGCEITQVSGDPNTDGSQFVLRLRCTDGTKIPAHWHPTDENVTVIKGTFLIGQGEKFDETKLATMKVGDFVSMPKEMRHFAMSKGESIVQVHGAGPFKINWVNPAEVIPPDAPAGSAAKPKP